MKEGEVMLNVLIIDDNLSLRKLLLTICSSLEVSAVGASNGQEGLECTKNRHFDFIFVDINMPIMGGIEFTKRFLEEDNHSKVILMSGTESESEIDPAIMEKVQFVAKPSIVQMIEKILLAERKLL